MTLTEEQLRLLDSAATYLNSTIADVSNGVKTRETAIALTHLETAELWLNSFIESTPGLRSQFIEFTAKRVQNKTQG